MNTGGLAVVLAALALGACGDDGGDRPRLIVSAAASLKTAITEYGERFPADLGEDGITIAIGQADVPAGAYARDVLRALPVARRGPILANVRSEEPDVAGITGKLVNGAVDAGFLHASDVRGAGGKRAGIALPRDLQPQIAYAVAVVAGTERPEAARAFVDGLLEGAGAQALVEARFRPPTAP